MSGLNPRISVTLTPAVDAGFVAVLPFFFGVVTGVPDPRVTWGGVERAPAMPWKRLYEGSRRSHGRTRSARPRARRHPS